MGIIQPVVFCAFLGEAWDPDELLGVIKQQVAKCDGGALPVIVGPEFLCARFGGDRLVAPVLSSDPKLELYQELVALSNNALVIPGTMVTSVTKGLRNLASAFYKGQEVAQVHKLKQGTPAEPKLWDKAVQFGSDLTVHPDTFVLRYGRNSETRFGIEICTDKGSMKEFLEEHHSAIGKWPEVYIQPSYGMSLSNYVTWNPARRAFQYRGLTKQNVVTWSSAKYSADSDSDSKVFEFDDFALHRIPPGVVIQSDGHLCRVIYKYSMRARYTFVPPLESVAVPGARFILEGCTLSVHRFPPVDLNPLKDYWSS
ncbi:hypothetical protein WMF37_25905 [Sorangium sp. So ce291]|uniref:hypothetical protein n=1 Tax=Sorangium sp. So ce291 TaxID=3133294 RepID=UPI003F62AAFE